MSRARPRRSMAREHSPADRIDLASKSCDPPLAKSTLAPRTRIGRRAAQMRSERKRSFPCTRMVSRSTVPLTLRVPIVCQLPRAALASTAKPADATIEAAASISIVFPVIMICTPESGAGVTGLAGRGSVSAIWVAVMPNWVQKSVMARRWSGARPSCLRAFAPSCECAHSHEGAKARRRD